MATQNYTFAVPSFTIHNTRALHKDTDYVSISLAVAGRQPMTKTRAMGDLNNGTFYPDLAFDNVPVDDEQAVIFSYLIVNNGHSDPNTVEKALLQAASVLAAKAAQAAAAEIGVAIGAALGASIGTAVVPVIGTALGALSGWLVSEIGTIVFANCDGPVAAAVHPFTGAQLRAATKNGSTMQTADHHPGTNSPWGCGSNSSYDVSWTMRRNLPVVYEHADYGGRSQVLDVGRYDVGQLSFGNDMISSVRVPPGWKVTLYQHAGFQAPIQVLTADTRALPPAYNDQASSIAVEKPGSVPV